VEEDRPRARRGRVVPIQFVGPHQCREEQCSVTHCGRPRATSPAPTRQHKTTYRKQFRTPSTVHQVGATAHHRQNDGTMELSSALLCPALPCSALLWRASCSLHPDCTKFEPATEQQDFVLFDRTLVCVFPRPSPDIGGAGGPSRGSCRLAANDPKAVQDGQATTQDPKDRASGFLSRPATGARANLASTRDYHFAGANTVSQFCWLVLRIGTDLILSSDGAGWWASQDDCLHPLAIYGKVFCFLGPHFPDTLQSSHCHWWVTDALE
jgi:hypothetical protein